MARTDVILDRLLKLHPKRIDLSLGRMERLLAALGHPERSLPPVIHVAGTNGKGSTIAFMRAMAEAAGLRAHAYTSPHLMRFHERIHLGGEGGGGPVSEAHLAELLEECEQANKGRPITFFEITTAAAFLAFSRRPADLLLLEVGLGGRLDATNVIARPAVTVITPVALDHAEFLGETPESVAAEKAGIIRPGVPLVCGPQGDAAFGVIAAAAERAPAPLFCANRDWQVFEQRGRLVWQDENTLFDLPLPALPGRFQVDNAGLAIAALRAWGDARIGEEAMAEGLRAARWPARMQYVASGALLAHLGPQDELWIDGGHNPHAGRALAAALAELHETAEKPLVMIAGMMAGKAAREWFSAFCGLATQAICLTIPGEENACPAAELAAKACEAGLAARTAGSLEEALRLAARVHPAGPARIVIAGSLYLAGHALRLNEGERE